MCYSLNKSNLEEFMAMHVEFIESAIHSMIQDESNQYMSVMSDSYIAFLKRGGKRLRPLLTCISFEMYSGNWFDVPIYSVAASIELIHNASLIIDDVEDNSLLRRNLPCFHMQQGVATAINAGNYMYFFPAKIYASSKLSQQQQLQLQRLFIQKLSDIHLGQGLDIYWSKEEMYSVSMDDYCTMASLKTSTLISLALQMGAILAGVLDERCLSTLDVLAYHIGLGFQIQDDVYNMLDVVKKTPFEDITEGKLTYLTSYVCTCASKNERLRLIEILTQRTTDLTLLHEAKCLFESSGAIENAKKKIEYHKKKANRLLDDLETSSVNVSLLREAIKKILP